MTVTVQFADSEKRRPARPPFPGADFVIVDGWACACGNRAIVGSGRHIENDNTYRADAHCGECRTLVGVVRAVVDTIFGLEEDEAVLKHGRARVYG